MSVLLLCLFLRRRMTDGKQNTRYYCGDITYCRPLYKRYNELATQENLDRFRLRYQPFSAIIFYEKD